MAEIGELGMVGTTFRRAGVPGLAYYTLPPEHEAGPAGGDGLSQASLRALQRACGCVESVYLATCNRVEFFFVTAHGVSVSAVRQRFFAFFAERARLSAAPAAPAAPFDDARRLHAFAGEGAVERLFVVAAALDSMVPGEAQILGQVKSAYSSSVAQGLAGSGLSAVFEAAFATAKRVRQLTALGAGRTSMLSLTLHAIEARLKTRRAAPAAKRPCVAIVGAGDMADQCGRALVDAGVTLLFINRTLARATSLAEQFGGEARLLRAYLDAPDATDVLITATASPVPLFAADFFARLPGTAQPLVVDLAVPPDVDGEAAREAGATVYDVASMQALAAAHSKSRAAAVSAARELIDDALDHYRIKEAERAMGRAISQVRRHGEHTVEQALQALKDTLPPDVVEAGWPHIERFARSTFGQLAHTSTRGLKALAHNHGAQALHAYLHGTGLEGPAPKPLPTDTETP